MKPRKIINEGEILMKNIKRNLLICLLTLKIYDTKYRCPVL